MFDSMQRASLENSATFFQAGSSGEARKHSSSRGMNNTTQDLQPGQPFSFVEHTFNQGQLSRSSLSLDDLEFLKENLFKF